MSSLHEDLGVRGRFAQEIVDLSRHTFAERSIYDFVLVSIQLAIV